jgi:hypothetical protein
MCLQLYNGLSVSLACRSLIKSWLGTTGRKSSSGDLDLSVDESQIDKETLIKALISNGVPNTDIKKSGDSVHVKTPILGDPPMGLYKLILCLANQTGKHLV